MGDGRVGPAVQPVRMCRVGQRHRCRPPEPNDDTGVGSARAETVALWVKLVATMGPDKLADFEERTFRQWDRASLSALRIAIDRRRQELLR